jgi:hypothetical protein
MKIEKTDSLTVVLCEIVKIKICQLACYFGNLFLGEIVGKCFLSKRNRMTESKLTLGVWIYIKLEAAGLRLAPFRLCLSQFGVKQDSRNKILESCPKG